MNVVYIKHFESGKKYVGITNNFKRRMKRHEQDSKSGSDFPVHRAMRKYSHETEIVFESECYDDVLKYEQIIIKNFKDLGYELYNVTDGGKGKLGVKLSEETKQKLRVANSGENSHMWGKHLSEETKQKIREANSGELNPMFGKNHTEESKLKMSKTRKGKYAGANHHNSKPKEYYETHSVPRNNFKRACKSMGWDFDDFEEVFSEWYIRPNGRKLSYYNYFYKAK